MTKYLLPLLFIVFSLAVVTSAKASTYIDESPVTRQVIVLNFNPIIESQGGLRLTQIRGWYNPNDLTPQIQSIFPEVSHNYLRYSIQSYQTIDDIPQKIDGFKYTDETYLACLNNTSTCHPDTNVGITVDYAKLFTDYQICSRNPDEVWIWGGPYFGYWEYTPQTQCGKTIFVMGFSYERGLAEAIHDFGHRTEYVDNTRVGDGYWQQNESNEWNKFSLINGHCGNVHYPPGATADYQYSNTYTVSTDCDRYLNYPNDTSLAKSITCTTWGCDQLGYMRWWLSHIPASPGSYQIGSKVIYANWWKYFVYYDATSTPPPSTNYLKFKFQGVTGQKPNQLVDLSITSSGTTQVLSNQTAFGDSQGIYTVNLAFSPNGTSQYFVKNASHLRRQVVPNQSTTINTLLAGDFIVPTNILDISDISAILSKYTSLSVPVSPTNQLYDVNLDGVINILDISIVLQNYTQLQVSGN